jgi:hypothetical protein
VHEHNVQSRNKRHARLVVERGVDAGVDLAAGDLRVLLLRAAHSGLDRALVLRPAEHRRARLEHREEALQGDHGEELPVPALILRRTS